MNQPVFYISNPDRKKEFATETLIYKRATGFSVVKRALYPEGAAHIKKLGNSYDQLTKLEELAKHAVVLPVRLQGNEAHFDFLEGVVGERALAEALLAGQQDQATAILQKFMDIIDAFPVVKPSRGDMDKFEKVFGATPRQSDEWLSPGIVDLNLDNFIIDEAGQWHLLDYEWVFDFPLPKKFIVQRFIFWFFYMRYRDLLLLARDKFSLLEVAENIFVPEFVYNAHQEYFDHMQNLLIQEESFQKFVHGRSERFSITCFDKPTKPSSGALEALAAQKTNLPSNYELLQQAHAELEAQHQQTVTTLQEIVNSKAYKYARRMQNVKGKLKT